MRYSLCSFPLATTTLRCFLLLLGASFIARSAASQASPFYPLSEGNRWIYRYYHDACNSQPPNCNGDGAFVGHEVVGEVVVEEALRARVRVRVYDQPGQEPTCTADYGVWFDEAAQQVRAVPIDGACSLAFGGAEMRSLAGWEPAAMQVRIGGVQYDVVAISGYDEDDYSGYTFTFGSEIGFVEGVESYHIGGSGRYDYYSYRLLYAEVGGEVFGDPLAVDSEDDPSTAGALSIGPPYPNPVLSVTMVTLSAPASAPVSLEIFDVLGHRVFRRDLGVLPDRTLQYPLDLTSLPAGFYVIRATTASGETATRRIVRIE